MNQEIQGARKTVTGQVASILPSDMKRILKRANHCERVGRKAADLNPGMTGYGSRAARQDSASCRVAYDPGEDIEEAS